MARRFNVIGTSASGKSTFSRKLADTLGVQHIELDALHWRPGWAETPRPELLAQLEPMLTGNSGWVLDGNYSDTIPLKWREVETVIWIDLPFHLNLWQSVKRACRRSWTKEEIWPGTGNVETWRTLFTRDSIVWWMIKTHRSNREKFEGYLRNEAYSKVEFVRLRSRKEMDQFLSDLHP